jgi:hypothetical protein
MKHSEELRKFSVKSMAMLAARQLALKSSWTSS